MPHLYQDRPIFWLQVVALMVKNLLANAGNTRDAGSVSGLGRSPGEGNGTQLQYSCLENSIDRRAWRAIVHGVAKSQTQVSTHIHQNTQKGD